MSVFRMTEVGRFNFRPPRTKIQGMLEYEGVIHMILPIGTVVSLAHCYRCSWEGYVAAYW